jgi:Mrp family chromosome partitioning ATPase
MSKNFELLHKISNEKDLFQTLDGWEAADETSVNSAPDSVFNGAARARTMQQSPLPDVFQAVNDSLVPLDLVTPDLNCDAKPAHKPIKEPLGRKVHGESQSTTLATRFPLSRNPITRLNANLDIPQAWVNPEIRPRRNDEIELELESETLPRIGIPGSAPTPEKAASSSDAKVQEPSPAEEEKTHPEPPHSQTFGNFGADDGKSIGESRAKRGRTRTRSAYRDPRREAIAREEELKLVQRIFLAEESSPRMILFSGFERDTGSGSICIRVGEILASQGEGSVCLVDIGFRVPSLHEYCGVPNDRGLAEAIADSNPIQEFAKQLSPANLWVIAGGQGASQMNFAKVADRLRARMEELRKTFRFVVVHSGSLWLNADAMLISKWTDGVVLVLEANSTRRDTARRIKESLAAANARVLGVVLNNRTYPIPETLYSRL